MNVDLSYQLIMGAAITSGFLVSRVSQRGLKMERGQRYAILMAAFCGAMIGAKLPFLFGDLEALRSGMAWLSSGKTILCGLVGGYAGVEIAKWCLDIQTKTGDSFTVPVAVSIAVGRWGCFHAGCCYGTPTELPWGVVFPSVDSLARHPTQLYESLFHAGAAVGFVFLVRAGVFKGNLFKVYIITYAIYRFLTETIRPEPQILFGMTPYQWMSLAIIAVFSALWYRDRAQVTSFVVHSA
jgi:phosphatidylglycerol:prolipoprotein diacylglycerol transferase